MGVTSESQWGLRALILMPLAVLISDTRATVLDIIAVTKCLAAVIHALFGNIGTSKSGELRE